MASELRIGTRGSPLALWQANTVAARIGETGGPRCRIVVIKTSGDRLTDAPLSDIGGKRLFVKEIEDALLANEIDLAVHSSKDMSAVLPDGLSIAGVLAREDALDAVVLPVRLKPDATGAGVAPARLEGGASASVIDTLIAELGQSPSIGTGSVRRIAQLTRLFPQAHFTAIRGNLETRLRKLDGGEYDALILAAAGLRRLGFQSRISLTLPVTACVPAPGQGIVAIETRGDDGTVRAVVDRIDDEIAGAALEAERALVAALGGGCQMPIGAFASPLDGEMLELVAVVLALDGGRAVRQQARGPRRDAAALGELVARQLVADGADELLADARNRQSSTDGRQPSVESRQALANRRPSTVERLRSASMTDD